MSNLKCESCGLHVKYPLTVDGCVRCNSKKIVKVSDTDKAWLNWYYKKVKGKK